MVNNLLIIVGIVAFFLLEKLTHQYLGGHEGHNHSHGDHSNTSKVNEKSKNPNKKSDNNKKAAD